MNVYIYGGANRSKATESVVEGNKQAEVGKTYKIDYRTGFLVVAYPNEKKTTDLDFSYRLVASGTRKVEEEKPAV